MEIFRRYKVLILLGIMLIGLVLFYNVTSKELEYARGKESVLKEEYKKEKDGVEVSNKNYLREKDSLEKAILARELENKKLKESYQKLEDKVKGLLAKPKPAPKNIQEMTIYFNTNYSTPDNKVIEERVGLCKPTAMHVIEDLEKGKTLSQVVVLKDLQLKNLDSSLVSVNKDKKDLKYNLILSEDQLENYHHLNNLAEDRIKNIETQNKRLKTKNLINKILIPTSIVIGVVIGTNIK